MFGIMFDMICGTTFVIIMFIILGITLTTCFILFCFIFGTLLEGFINQERGLLQTLRACAAKEGGH